MDIAARMTRAIRRGEVSPLRKDQINLEVHVHPRSSRLEHCWCKYPAMPCKLGSDERGNFCYKYDELGHT